MKRILSLFGIFVFLLCTQSVVFGQQTISENKRKLITELVEVMGGQKQAISLMNAMMDSQEKVYFKLIENQFANKGLSESKKAQLSALAMETYKRISQKMRNRINELDLETFYDDLSIEIYDKYFTEEDLTNLIAFYRTPTGKKMLDNSSNIAIDSMNAVQEKMLPPLMKIIDEIMEEEMPTVVQEIERSLDT